MAPTSGLPSAFIDNAAEDPVKKQALESSTALLPSPRWIAHLESPGERPAQNVHESCQPTCLG